MGYRVKGEEANGDGGARFNDTSSVESLLLRNLTQLSFSLALIASTLSVPPFDVSLEATNCYLKKGEFDSDDRGEFCVYFDKRSKEVIFEN